MNILEFNSLMSHCPVCTKELRLDINWNKSFPLLENDKYVVKTHIKELYSNGPKYSMMNFERPIEVTLGYEDFSIYVDAEVNNYVNHASDYFLVSLSKNCFDNHFYYHAGLFIFFNEMKFSSFNIETTKLIYRDRFGKRIVLANNAGKETTSLILEIDPETFFYQNSELPKIDLLSLNHPEYLRLTHRIEKLKVML